MTAALDLMSGLVLEDGRTWGDTAAGFQWRATQTILDSSAAPYMWDSRPRGGSKTTDAAGWCVVSMLETLRPGSRLYAFASDKDQGRLLVEALAGLVARTPALQTALQVDAYRVVAKRSGCVLEVLPADVASAYGLRPAFVIADEVCQWPTGAGSRGLWEAVWSAMPKVPGSRLACITTSGDPAHWTKKAIFDPACRSPRWSVFETPGPLPWVSADVLAEQRASLTDSSYARLHLNQWAASEDRLVDPETLAEAVVLRGPLDPSPGVTYRVGVDLGLRHDRTAIAVAHTELAGEAVTGPAQRRCVVLDRLVVMEGSRGNEVQLSVVEEAVADLSARYNRARVRLDPWQGIGLAQRLRPRGVPVEEWSYSDRRYAAGAATLFTLLRDRLLHLYDHPLLLEEMATVRMKEAGSSGLLRMDHDSSGHDDMVQALSFAAVSLLESQGWSKRTPLSALELEQRRRANWRPRDLGILAGLDPEA
jgi:phage terminase large subunit-like protein